METNERNYGIEIARIVSMLMIIINHSLNRGGVVYSAQNGTALFYLSWGLMMLVYPAVNIFALISGYVAYSDKKRKVKYSRLAEIWLIAVFYGLLINVFFNAVRPDLVSTSDYIKAVLPISSGTYWYLTAFAGMFLLKPFLDAGLREMSEGTAIKLFVVIFISYSLYNSLIERFGVMGGFSVLWIVLLYIMGAIIKKCRIGENVKKLSFMAGIVFFYFLTFIIFIIITNNSEAINGILGYLNLSVKPDFFASITYASPTILLMAILSLLLFSRIKVGKIGQKVLYIIAPTVFSAYIINCHGLIWNYVINNFFVEIINNSALYILYRVIVFSVGFLLVSIMIDYLRVKLFEVIRIRKGLEWVEKKINYFVGKIGSSL